MARRLATTDARLSILEDQMAELLRRAGRPAQRAARAAAPPAIRLAKTVKDPNTNTYPAGGATAYWVKFLDCDFSDADDGSPTLTRYERQQTAKKVAFVIGAGGIAEGTVVSVFPLAKKWYIQQGGGAAGGDCFIAFRLTAALTKGNQFGFATLKEVIVGSAGHAVGDSIQVENHPALPNLFVFEGAVGDFGLGLWLSSYNRYRIIWITCPQTTPTSPPPSQTGGSAGAAGGTAGGATGSPPPQSINPGGVSGGAPGGALG